MPPAPDWGPGIPSTWERCGPAWQFIYWELPDRLWTTATDVGDTYAEELGLSRSTITGMVRKAALAGLLERKRKPGRKIRWLYRRRTS